MNKLIIIVNEDRFFLSHRKDIAVRALQEGFEVLVACKDTGQMQAVRDLGLRVVDLPINPTGMSLGAEMETFRFLCRLFRTERSDVVHLVGLKAALWGGLAGRLTGVPGMLMAYSGLGVMFGSERLSVTAKGVLMALRWGHRGRRSLALFQNDEDRDLFLAHRVVRPEQCRFIKGSGVDLTEFAFRPDPDNARVQVIFTGRMVREKGALLLCDAAERLRERYASRAQFLLCGRLSNTPGSLTQEELEARLDGDYIQWLGLRSDVKELLSGANIFAFPSFYREGLPKSVIEAEAIGMPVVTTDSVGCRDTVEDGVNGFLIPVQDVEALTDRLARLIDDRELRLRMGRASREKAEREFSLSDVVRKHMDLYRELLGA